MPWINLLKRYLMINISDIMSLLKLSARGCGRLPGGDRAQKAGWGARLHVDVRDVVVDVVARPADEAPEVEIGVAQVVPRVEGRHDGHLDRHPPAIGRGLETVDLFDTVLPSNQIPPPG